MSLPPPGKMVDIGGRRLHVDITGNGRARIILEAGIAASSLSWAPAARRLAEFATVVTYDRAGFGWSDPPTHRCTALDAARDLGLMLGKIQMDQPLLLVGHSFGGLIVRIFQQIHPERVGGMVLLDPVCRSEWREADPSRKRMLARGVLLSRRGEFLARLGVVRLALHLLLNGGRSIPKLLARVSAGRGAGVTERLAGEVRKMPPELWPKVAAHWSRARSFHSMADALENLPLSVTQLDEKRSLGELPLVVLSAGHANAETLREHEHDARLSTHGEHRIVAGSGHWIQLDAPDAVADAVRSLI